MATLKLRSVTLYVFKLQEIITHPVLWSVKWSQLLFTVIMLDLSFLWFDKKYSGKCRLQLTEVELDHAIPGKVATKNANYNPSTHQHNDSWNSANITDWVKWWWRKWLSVIQGDSCLFTDPSTPGWRRRGLTPQLQTVTGPFPEGQMVLGKKYSSHEFD